jgi:hypothetical protein
VDSSRSACSSAGFPAQWSGLVSHVQSPVFGSYFLSAPRLSIRSPVFLVAWTRSSFCSPRFGVRPPNFLGRESSTPSADLPLAMVSGPCPSAL